MRTVTVSHNWYSFPWCSGIAIPTVFGVLSDISCRDWGRVCRAWLGLVGMEAELGHSLTATNHFNERLANSEMMDIMSLNSSLEILMEFYRGFICSEEHRLGHHIHDEI